VISPNIGDAGHTFGRNCISEFDIGCVQVDDARTPAITKVWHLLTLKIGESKERVDLALTKGIV
jgi:hypothetical protein